MALLVLGASKCSLCGEILARAQDVVANSAFIDDVSDPFWKYSDSGMHRQCFLDWADREEFIAKFNEVHSAIVYGNNTSKRMLDDGTISLVKPDA